ncbi:hypothetical protein PVAND_012006 [Polypedilum vanderplanki]|uniref:Ion transport domain-containing protein n=1 Tax=Polypedilum vanderplanki TaxID=319348 RepID=A0A9J6CL14_POLVA|nr:hypothetical protein PVAND_012006 [Polypedilum vanderplanki]
MGNTESNVTSGVKKQAGVSTQKLYKLVNLKGGGLLVDMMKRAINNKQFAEIDHAIKTKVEPFLYNKGRGRYIPIAQIVKMRNCERPKHKQLPDIRILENPEEDYDIHADCPEVSEADYLINPSGYREVCWDLKERGAVGETILHLCFLNATSLHADLAKRLLRFYPKLINDIYMCDEYYGENVLHIAIVNEDPAAVKFLLDSGADIHERCFGTFMSPEDQKGTRYDVIEHEAICVNPITNYEGYVYWGEYPLSFAACLCQEECYRLVLAKKADPDNQDINGNTVLHLLVIHEKLSTFDMAYETGANLYIKNNLNLTPLTLAAKLARVEMFFHILNIDREIYWQLGSITCAAYPLEQLDTINTKTGNINKDSVLNLVVFGDKDEHLDLLEGVLIDLLKTKWNTFVKAKFYQQFYLFTIYFFISLFAFLLRPKAFSDDKATKNGNSTQTDMNVNDTINAPVKSLFIHNLTEIFCNYSAAYADIVMQSDMSMNNLSIIDNNSTLPMDDDEWSPISECPLLDISTLESRIKLSAEALMTVGALLYILTALREARFLGAKMFFENLSTAPSRVMFLFSCILMLTIPFIKFFCLPKLEDHVAVAIMLTTGPYFLFFCRGFKTVGPFVVMIYRMVVGDLLRFVTIYMVFVMGFSQAYYIIFLTFDNSEEEEPDPEFNPIASPMESFISMFLMSLGNFGDYYGGMEYTAHEMQAKTLFVLFMAIVAVLLINMLIAMMGNTYTKIAETKNEWQRQWARIVLVVERSVPPHDRLKNFNHYSQIMADGRTALILRLNMTVSILKRNQENSCNFFLSKLLLLK